MANWYADLGSELAVGHPVTGAYDADHQLAADQVNALNRTRNRSVMSGGEVKKEIDTAEFNALTDGQKQIILAMCARDDLDPFGLDADVVQNIFPPAGVTITALQAARVESISRATELGLPFVSAADVAAARG